MRAVVVYESMYGNTHLVTDAIGAGLRSDFEVSVVPVSQASPAVLAGADLVVVGGPTHVHGFAVVAKPESFLVTRQDRLEPHETTRAREWGARLAAGIVPSRESSTQVSGSRQN